MVEANGRPPPDAARAWAHILALAVAAVALLLIVAGGATTTLKAGDSIPHWTFRFWSWFRDWRDVDQVTEGGFYELSHRQVGTVLGFVMLGLCLLLQRTEPRRAVRRLAWAILLGLVVQGLLGALRVLVWVDGTLSQDLARRLTGLTNPGDLRLLLSMLHAPLAYALFGAIAALAVATAPVWGRAPAPAGPDAAPLRRLAWWTTGVIFAQLILGAYIRHSDVAYGQTRGGVFLGLIAHIGTALLAGVLSGWTLARAAGAGPTPLRRTAAWLAALTQVQIALGVLTYVFVYPEARAANPWLKTAHQTVGPLVLALSVALNCWCGARAKETAR